MVRIDILDTKGRIVTRLFRRGLIVVTLVWSAIFQLAVPVSADGLSKISFRDKIYDIAILSDEVFVVGFPGILLYSPNRGDSFSSIKVPTTDALFAIDMTDNGFGAIVGRDGLMLITRDRGKHWTQIDTGTNEHLFSVSVIPGGKIWAVGHFGTIIHSADGGKSWKAQTYDSTLPESTDKGELNERQGDNLTAEEENQGAADEARLNAVTFVDATTGWIVGEFGLVLHTEDGGTTWKRQRSNASLVMFSIYAVDRRNLLAVGSEGTLIETEDGGQSWNRLNTGVSEHLLDVIQLHDKRSIVGYDGLILVQENRGNALRRIPAGIYSWLGSIAFVDARLGFAAGGRGYLLKTTDGGKHWQSLTAK